MPLDPQKLRALAPMLSDSEYRRRQRRLLAIAIGALIAAVGLISVISYGALTARSENARMLVAFALLCWGVLAGFSFLGLLVLWFGQATARRAHAYADELEGRTS